MNIKCYKMKNDIDNKTYITYAENKYKALYIFSKKLKRFVEWREVDKYPQGDKKSFAFLLKEFEPEGLNVMVLKR